jgi:hypothetical protein
MTNRQWLIWKLIDMPDKEFADRVCSNNRAVWSCEDCIENKVNDVCCQDCEEKFHKWLQQEHKEGEEQ